MEFLLCSNDIHDKVDECFSYSSLLSVRLSIISSQLVLMSEEIKKYLSSRRNLLELQRFGKRETDERHRKLLQNVHNFKERTLESWSIID